MRKDDGDGGGGGGGGGVEGCERARGRGEARRGRTTIDVCAFPLFGHAPTNAYDEKTRFGSSSARTTPRQLLRLLPPRPTLTTPHFTDSPPSRDRSNLFSYFPTVFYDQIFALSKDRM